ncbi:MAG: hypothetical protein ACYCPQ_02000 [Elusimicrobiota bacterium]
MNAYAFAMIAAAVLPRLVFAQNADEMGTAFNQAGQAAANYTAARNKQDGAKAAAAQKAAANIAARARFLEQQLESGGPLNSEGMKDSYAEIKQLLDYEETAYQANAPAANGASGEDSTVKNSIKTVGEAYLQKAPAEAVHKVDNIECDGGDGGYRVDDCVYIQKLEDAGVISSNEVINEDLRRAAEKNRTQDSNSAGAVNPAKSSAQLPPGCSANLYANCKAVDVRDFECKPCASVIGN